MEVQSSYNIVCDGKNASPLLVDKIAELWPFIID